MLVTTEEDTEKVLGITGKDHEDAAVQLTRRFPLRAAADHDPRQPAGVEERWTAIACQEGRILKTRTYEVEIVDRSGPATRSRRG